MQNFHGVLVQYLGATNTRGSRVKLTSTRHGDSITLPLDYAHNTCYEQAAEWLQDHGQRVIGRTEWKHGNNSADLLVLAPDVNDQFLPLKQMREGGYTNERSYPIVAAALRSDENKARAIVYGTHNAAITNEAVAMSHFIDSRMHSTEITRKLAELD
jgi:hypothetical protein